MRYEVQIESEATGEETLHHYATAPEAIAHAHAHQKVNDLDRVYVNDLELGIGMYVVQVS